MWEIRVKFPPSILSLSFPSIPYFCSSSFSVTSFHPVLSFRLFWGLSSISCVYLLFQCFPFRVSIFFPFSLFPVFIFPLSHLFSFPVFTCFSEEERIEKNDKRRGNNEKESKKSWNETERRRRKQETQKIQCNVINQRNTKGIPPMCNSRHVVWTLFGSLSFALI